MEYKGGLYGKVGKIYFPLCATAEEYDLMVQRISELQSEVEDLRKNDLRDFREWAESHYGEGYPDRVWDEWEKNKTINGKKDSGCC